MSVHKYENKALCSWVELLLSFYGGFLGLSKIIQSTRREAAAPRGTTDKLEPNTVNHNCLQPSEEIFERIGGKLLLLIL